MKNLILLLIVTIFFSACSESSLEMGADNELVLKNSSQTYTISKTFLSAEHITLFNLDVKKIRVADSFSKPLFYEKVTTHNDYELKYPSLETLQKIFNVSSVNVVHQTSSLLFVQLEKEKHYINLIAETSSMGELSYVYGFSNREFYELASAMNIVVDRLQVKNFQRANMFESQWMRKELILDPLAESNAGWGGF